MTAERQAPGPRARRMPRSQRPPPLTATPAGTRAERLAIAPNRTPPAEPRYTGSPNRARRAARAPKYRSRRQNVRLWRALRLMAARAGGPPLITGVPVLSRSRSNHHRHDPPAESVEEQQRRGEADGEGERRVDHAERDE